jgi:Spy/CpxP family protein refolding chaperone
MTIRSVPTLAFGIACAALLLLAGPSSRAQTAAAAPAQAPVPDAQAAEQALALTRTRLNLTPEQTEKVRPLMQAYVSKLRRLFVDYTNRGSTVMPEFVQEFEKTRADFRASLMPMLSDPQKVSLEQLRKEVDDQLRELTVSQRLGILKNRLSLTPEQETAIAPIIRDDFDQKRAVLVGEGDTPVPADRQATLSQDVMKIQAATETRLAAVLTPEQMKKYQSGRAAKNTAAAKNQARPRSSGSVTVKVLPRPTTLSTWIDPPCASASQRARERPRPDPLSSRARAGSAR